MTVFLGREGMVPVVHRAGPCCLSRSSLSPLLPFLCEPQGNPRAAADNLTCRVHDVDQLSCSWAVGEEAPADVQYQFYLQQSV